MNYSMNLKTSYVINLRFTIIRKSLSMHPLTVKVFKNLSPNDWIEKY